MRYHTGALFFCLLIIGFVTRPAGAINEPSQPLPPNVHQIQASVKDLGDALNNYNEQITRDIQAGKAGPDDLLVRSRMTILEAWGEDEPISSFSVNKALAATLHAQLNAIQSGQKTGDEKNEKSENLTLKDLRTLLDHRASGAEPKVELSPSQLEDLAAILQLENEKKANGDKKNAPSDEELLRSIAIKELLIHQKDSGNRKLELPDSIKKALENAYIKDHPDEADAVKKNGLTSQQAIELLKKPNRLKNSELATLIGSLGQQNLRTGGDEYQWGIASDLYRNVNAKERMAHPKSPEPPSLEKVREYFAKQAPAASGDTSAPENGRREMHDLGAGPSIGGAAGGSGGITHNSFDQSQSVKNPHLPSRPSAPATLTPDDLDCLKKLRETKHTTEFTATYKNVPGIFHCGLAFVSKDPAKMKAVPERVPGKEGICFADAVIAKHCVYKGAMTGISVAGVSQVYSYNLDVQSESEPISGGDDGAHLVLGIPCEEIPNLQVERPMTPAEYRKLSIESPGHFPLLLGRNCVVNEDPSSPNNCGIFAEGSLSPGEPAFAGFNSNFPPALRQAYNHGSATEQGDSGSPAMTCVKKGDVLQPVWMGSVSYVHGFPGVTGGIASGTFLSHMDRVLPNFPSKNGDYQTPTTSPTPYDKQHM